MNYDINRPWLSLDEWQKEYIDTDADKDCFLLCGRQVGKTTAMSIKAVELCINQFKKGEFILICSITEKQAYHMLAKALTYAQEVYPSMIMKGKDKPTMHKISFKNGTGIHCYAAGETGEGLRGYTIKKLMIDEGSRMSEEFFIAVSPMLSIVNGSMDIASTPAGKKHKTGELKFFYKCSLDDKFIKFYVNAKDCPRHSVEFLDNAKSTMSKLAYAQEYEAVFTDELLRLFSDELINKICTLTRDDVVSYNYTNSKIYVGVDVAGFGLDSSAYSVLARVDNNLIQLANIEEQYNYTFQTSAKILQINTQYHPVKIGVDDGGIGFGVFSELMNNSATKRKTVALNNASRPIDQDGEKSKKILKEEMYMNLLVLMENSRIKLLNDDEIKASLSSIQHEDGKIFGSYSHITEAIIRACWLAERERGLNIFVHGFN